MTPTRRLTILSKLPHGLVLYKLAKKLCCTTKEARALADKNGYGYVDGRGKPGIMTNEKQREKYENLDWARGTSWLQRKTGLSRQSLSTRRQELDFLKLFSNRKTLSYNEAKKEMRNLQQFRKGLNPSRSGRLFKDLTRVEYERFCLARGIEIGK